MSRRSVTVGLVVALVAAGLIGPGPATALADDGTRVDWWNVSAGGEHTCGLDHDARLWCWGYNAHGQLGVGDTVNRSRPVQVRPDRRWQHVSAGHRHTCGLSDNAVFCWGANEFGQLGDGTWTARTVPTRVAGAWELLDTSYFHTCAVRRLPDDFGGDLWCWGWNGEGQLGAGDRVTRNAPVQVDVHHWWDVRTGYAHTCGVRRGLPLYCWGRGDHGQLGLGDTADRLTPRRVGDPITDLYRAVAVGADHTCAVLSSVDPYRLQCWGRNHQGQLGLGGYASTSLPTAVPVPAAAPPGEYFRAVGTHDSHTCALTHPAETMWCWGWNAFGQLGTGTTTGSPSPRRVTVAGGWVGVPGVAHTCTVAPDGLWCWGRNRYGQLGLGDTTDRLVPTRVGPAPIVPPPHG